MKKIISVIEQLNVGKVDLLALITDSSSDVVFYCNINGKQLQSNNLVEEGLMDSIKMDNFYKEVTSIIRKNENFKTDKMNIIKVNQKNEITFSYADKNCRVYSIKKEWKNSL